MASGSDGCYQNNTTSPETPSSPSHSLSSVDSVHAPPLPTLSFDLISEILCRLPVKLLLQLQYECKSWNSLISDPKFVKKHLSLSTTRRIYKVCYSTFSCKCFVMSSYPFDSDVATDEDERFMCPFNFYDKDYYIVGSCNGILCIANYTRITSVVILLNPSTGKFRELPLFQKPPGVRHVQTTYGFGYDSLTDNYKVVVVLCYPISITGGRLDKTEVKVHTLGTDFWRDIQEFPFGFVPSEHLGQLPFFTDLVQQSGQFVSGTINWLASKGWFRGSPKIIVSFDLGNESYQEVLQPDYGEVDGDNCLNLGVLRDCLCIICRYDVWIMKEYGNKESWTKLYNVPYMRDPNESFIFTKPMYIFDDDHQVLLESSVNSSKKLMVYNSRNSTCNFIEFPNNSHCFPKNGSPEVCVESLILP